MKHLERLTALYGEDLAIEQLKLEAEAYQLGEKRFLDAMEYKNAVGQGADTNVVRPVLATFLPKFSEELVRFIEENTSGKPGRKAAAFRPLMGVNADRIALVSLRAIFNAFMINDTTTQSMVNHCANHVEAEARYGRIRDRDEAYFNRITAPEIRKRSGDFFKKAYMQAVESGMAEEGTIDKWDRWSPSDRVAVGLKCIEVAINIGLVTMYSTDVGTKNERKHLELAPEVSRWMSERKDFMAGMCPVWSPTVVPPQPWQHVFGGGYWGEGRAQPRFIRGVSKVVQRRYRDVDLTKVLDAVNTIQNTPWAINKRVLEIAREVVFWENPPVQDMPSRKLVELPERIEGMDDDKALLKSWKKDAARAYRSERTRKSRRISLENVIEQATRFVKYERIWFPHNVDFRGRVYAIPSFSPQGTDVAKGLLQLADPSPMGDTGEYWLRMHLANTAGFDKEPMDVRQQWTKDNEGLILDTADNPLDNLWWATDSDSPFCFLAACIEYAQWKRSDNPKEYRCGVVVAFDGTCSGIQHFSAMLKDEVGGAAVNLVPAPKPSDIYRIVADKVNLVLNKDLEFGSDDIVTMEADEETGELTERIQYGEKSAARWWLAAKVTRQVTKRSVMTLPYGSKKFGFADQLLEDIIRPRIERQGEAAFPAPSAAARYLAGLIWDALGTTVVAAVGAMAWLQKAAGALASQNMGAHWVTPAGFPVWQEYRVRKTTRVDTIICGSIRMRMDIQKGEHKDEMDESHTLDKLKQVSAISPNFVHSMDGSHLMLTALKGYSEGVEHFAMIHDSYGTCPGNAGVLFKVVRETFVETYEHRDVMLEFKTGFENLLTEKSLEKIPPLPPKGNLDIASIRDSLYCFG